MMGRHGAVSGAEDDDEAHVKVQQQVRIEVSAEAAQPTLVAPLVTWLEIGVVLVKGVAEEELARHDSVK